MKRLAILILILPGFVWSLALGADWNSTQLEVPSGVSNASLGTNGHAAAVDASGRVHLVLQSNLEGGLVEVIYSSRSPSGQWSEAEVISPPGQIARNASTTIDQDGVVHVFWEDVTMGTADSEIGYRTRTPAGTWEDPQILQPGPGISHRPAAAVDGFNRIHLVWVDGRVGNQQQILYSRADTDRVWIEPVVISVGGVIPDRPSIDVDGFGKVHIVWSDRGLSSEPSEDIVYLRIDQETGLDPQPVRLVSHLEFASDPFLDATADGTVHLVWLDDRDASHSAFREIYYKRFLPGVGWGKDKRFTYDRTEHQRPVIAQGASNTLNIAWEDYRSGNPEIYYRQITWETGWDRDLTRLTTDNSASLAPSLVPLANGGLILFWADAQGTGTSRIFTKLGNEDSAP